MLGEELLVDPGVVVMPLQIAHGDQVAEVAPALLVLGEEDQVVRDPLAPILSPLGPGHVGFAAEDGLDPGVLGLLVEVDRAEEVPVVRDGNGGHLLLPHRLHEILHADGSIEQGVEGVEVEVDEVSSHVQSLTITV